MYVCVYVCVSPQEVRERYMQDARRLCVAEVRLERLAEYHETLVTDNTRANEEVEAAR